MKKYYLSIWIALLTTLILVSYSNAGLSDGLVAHYKFENNSKDQKGVFNGTENTNVTFLNDGICTKFAYLNGNGPIAVSPNY
jgi:hypothetical protein